MNYFARARRTRSWRTPSSAWEAAGLGDSIHLAPHDEQDTEAAEAVAEIMRTPPEFLPRTGGRVPVFKTDTNDMGTAWAYLTATCWSERS